MAMNVDSTSPRIAKTEELPKPVGVKGDIKLQIAEELILDAKYSRIAISGAFPVPLEFFKTINYLDWGLEELKLKDFLDVEATFKLYKEMFEACKRENVQLLIIQSPPAAYFALKQILEEYIFRFVDNYQVAASECLALLIDKILESGCSENYKLSVLFLLPSKELIGKTYHDEEVNPETIIKGFPKLIFAAPYDQKVFLLGKASASYIDPLVEKFVQTYPTNQWQKLIFTEVEKLFKYV